MEISAIIGNNLQQLRKEQGLSLDQLALKTGVSKAVLSQLENGKANPTINTIWKIATALHVTYSALLEPPRENVQKVAYTDLRPQLDEAGQYRISCYYPTSQDRDFEIYLLELDPGASHMTEGHPAPALEYLLVKQGQLTMTVGGQVFTLEAGDSLRFDASLRHTYQNSENSLMQAYCINQYPRA